MPESWAFDAIGTRWEIVTDEPVPGVVRQRIAAAVEGFDRAWSRFRPDSAVTALAEGAGHAIATDDGPAMLAAFDALSEATSGAVNPLLGDSLTRLGYDAALSLRASGPALPARPDWRAWLRAEGTELRLAPPAEYPSGRTHGSVPGSAHGSLQGSGPGMIDVGALGKGRLVDVVVAIVAEHCAGDVTVDASGDLVVSGAAVRVGLEHPFDTAKAIGVVELRNQAMAASASNRRSWGDGLHHVLDARTGLPVRSVVATWAIAEGNAESPAMHADAIATALFFAGGAELAHRWGVRWVRMLSDGRVETSPENPAELFTRAGSVGS